MANPLVIRKNRLFCLNDSELPESAKNTGVKNALYAVMHFEYAGAAKNPKYKNLTNQQKMASLNQFAADWLDKEGYK